MTKRGRERCKLKKKLFQTKKLNRFLERSHYSLPQKLFNKKQAVVSIDVFAQDRQNHITGTRNSISTVSRLYHDDTGIMLARILDILHWC